MELKNRLAVYTLSLSQCVVCVRERERGGVKRRGRREGVRRKETEREREREQGAVTKVYHTMT